MIGFTVADAARGFYERAATIGFAKPPGKAPPPLHDRPTLEALAAIASAAADAAGAAIRPHFRTQLAADLKADASPVTLADQGAEAAIRAVLAERTPNIPILGEEQGGTATDQGDLWVIDPIDGTRAFITGRPLFGTLIGLVRHGVPVVGIIDQPVLGERWTGISGLPTRFDSPLGGAGLVRTRACPTLAQAEFASTSPAVFRPVEWQRFQKLSASARRTSWGGDCYAYGLLSLGLIDIVTDATMQPWDWAALVPVIEGAGGIVTDWAGQALRFGTDGRVLAVGDPLLLDPVLAILRD
jgi:histidinol phosphatase-like enzyme (inositol monophosphatase family)